MLAPEEANQLLEPGSGVPDVKKILERVRAGQMSRGGKQAADGDKADFIAAARRAAQLAVEEADTLNKTKDSGVAGGVGGAFARHRRPILMAVGAVLLAIMSYPLVGAMLKGSDAPVAEPVAIIEQHVGASRRTAGNRQRNGDRGRPGTGGSRRCDRNTRRSAAAHSRSAARFRRAAVKRR